MSINTTRKCNFISFSKLYLYTGRNVCIYMTPRENACFVQTMSQNDHFGTRLEPPLPLKYTSGSAPKECTCSALEKKNLKPGLTCTVPVHERQRKQLPTLGSYLSPTFILEGNATRGSGGRGRRRGWSRCHALPRGCAHDSNLHVLI